MSAAATNGIALLITLWLASGMFKSDDEASADEARDVTTVAAPQSKVRTRTQSAEEIMRTIVVNGKTAPARIVDLAAETDGRIEFVGAKPVLGTAPNPPGC